MKAMRNSLIELIGKELMNYVSWQTEMALAGNYDVPSAEYAIRTDNKKNNKRICVEGNFEICEPYGNYTHYYSSTFNLSSIGKSVFNTKEEALKSIK